MHYVQETVERRWEGRGGIEKERRGGREEGHYSTCTIIIII